jgi:hypothetical protein
MDQTFAFGGYTTSNLITCTAEGETIYQTDYLGNKTPVGKTLAAYQELEATTKQYYDKLVELGVIVPEKSQAELMAEMQNTMLSMSQIIAGLSNELKELKESGLEQHSERSGADAPRCKSK